MNKKKNKTMPQQKTKHVTRPVVLALSIIALATLAVSFAAMALASIIAGPSEPSGNSASETPATTPVTDAAPVIPVYDNEPWTSDDAANVRFYDISEDVVLSLVTNEANTVKVVTATVSSISDDTVCLDAGAGNLFSFAPDRFPPTVALGDAATVYVLLANNPTEETEMVSSFFCPTVLI